MMPARDAVLLVALCAAWGFAQVTMKWGGEGISPLVQAGLRSALAIPFILLWCRLRGVTVFRRDGTLPAGLLAGLLFSAEFWAIFRALELTSAARVVVLLYTAPFFAVIGAHFLVRGDRLTRRKLMGLVIAFASVPVLFADRLGAPGDGALMGDLIGLASGLFWGGTMVTIKASGLTRIASERTLLYQLAVSALLIPLGYAIGERGVFDPSPRVLGSLAFQVLGIAVVSYLAWFWLVKRHAASAFAPFLFLTPAFGVACGWLLLGEAVTPALLASLLLVGAGIWVINRGE
ncbi:DMT family transporter [Falsiroseomonas ponticola]|uniref:DMT family transporter n=1 Tax=Falsiroseomonas ponticola TaxID=2786951 RepID=UPI0019337D4F|nr:DMT family transporter [Roseomonas ponticola]